MGELITDFRQLWQASRIERWPLRDFSHEAYMQAWREHGGEDDDAEYTLAKHMERKIRHAPRWGRRMLGEGASLFEIYDRFHKGIGGTGILAAEAMRRFLQDVARA